MNRDLSSEDLMDRVAKGDDEAFEILVNRHQVSVLNLIYRFIGDRTQTKDLGMFLPSLLFVGLLSRILPFVRKSPFAATFLDGVNASSLGLMAGVTVQLGQTALIDTFTVVLLAITLFVIFRFRINSVWLILGAGLLGAIYKFVLG